MLRTETSNPKIMVVGIDVGGAKKGFHAVALISGAYFDRYETSDLKELSDWCRNARVIAIDAPCSWSRDGRSRPAEHELMGNGIWCFSTPTRDMAVRHRTNHFGWMRNGEKLFGALKDSFPICRDLPSAGQKCCFETYPHAITWHLRGGNADASQKREQRRVLLEEAGINCSRLTNIDLVDAALCAHVAYLALRRAL